MIYWRLAPPTPHVLHHFTIFEVSNMICFVALILHDFSCHSWYCGSVVKFYLETFSRATCFKFHMRYHNILQKKTEIYWSVYLKSNCWLSISETCTVTIINIQRKLAAGIIRGWFEEYLQLWHFSLLLFCSSVSWFGNPLGQNAFVYSFGSPKNV